MISIEKSLLVGEAETRAVFAQSDLVLLALHLGIPGDISAEYLPDERRLGEDVEL